MANCVFGGWLPLRWQSHCSPVPLIGNQQAKGNCFLYAEVIVFANPDQMDDAITLARHYRRPPFKNDLRYGD